MKFTRKEVLQAIRHEPLAPGSWIEVVDWEKPLSNKNCTVCAVGGLLRRKGMPLKQITERAGKALVIETGWDRSRSVGAEGDYELALEEKNYLRALSIRFEQLSEKFGTGKRTRNILANFVKKNFPAKFIQSV